MTTAKEIEFKTMLTAEEFQRVKTHYQLTEKTVKKQTNYYFDTPDQRLKKRHWGLRIRLYPDSAEQTLKIPASTGGLWEITDSLTLKEAQRLTKKAQLKADGQIANKLASIGIKVEEIVLLADLTTARWEFKIPAGLLAIDESWYGNGHDYELELEVSDFTQGKEQFQHLLTELDLTFRPGANKITRAIKEK
ncbi:CYTH domain-containing protein [Enterococcus sp. 2201sp1_2201st1_B8_2201SCRN_220225]|uniref:CYTH domain-containing protein n=1 Tax=unclassified Enterococcus TaxID=2608891 RepID=UPI0034A27CA5